MKHLSEQNDPVMNSILVEVQHMLTEGKSDLPLSLCFAAMREDDMLLHKLLRQGKDPNELDSTGRTPLVCNFLCFIMHSHIIHKKDRRLMSVCFRGLKGFLFCMPQHIAASKGSMECVLVLLDYGANPNSKGMFSHGQKRSSLKAAPLHTARCEYIFSWTLSTSHRHAL